VSFQRLGEPVVAESEDLGLRGVFVRTAELLPIGSVVDLHVSLAPSSEFRVTSRVAHLLAPSAARALGRHAGMGFEFLDDERSEGLRQLTEYLEEVIEDGPPALEQVPEGCSVLVAEPSPPLLARLRHALGRLGFEVLAVPDGVDAMPLCAARRPDIIVAAASMPVVDGWTLLRLVRARDELQSVPFVLLSEDASDMTRLEAYRRGVDELILKPFTDEELCIRLRRLVGDAGTAANPVLRGNLAEISVSTLLTLLEFERKSGVLSLHRAGQLTQIFVARGQVAQIEGGGGAGELVARLLPVLDWEDGTFEFRGCDVTASDSGWTTQQLILEHARLRDERSARRPEE
jgi:CheY-like chemotaxis protein/Tfp pilus assembly protein PilZ